MLFMFCLFFLLGFSGAVLWRHPAVFVAEIPATAVYNAFARFPFTVGFNFDIKRGYGCYFSGVHLAAGMQ